MSSTISHNPRDRKRQKTKTRTPTPAGSSGASKEISPTSPKTATPEGYSTPGDETLGFSSLEGAPEGRPISPNRFTSPASTPKKQDIPSPGAGAPWSESHETVGSEFYPKRTNVPHPPDCYYCYLDWRDEYLFSFIVRAFESDDPASTATSDRAAGEEASEPSYPALTPRVHFGLGRVLVCTKCGCALPAPRPESLPGQREITRPEPCAETPGAEEPRLSLSVPFARLLVEEPRISPEDRVLLLPHQVGACVNGQTDAVADLHLLKKFRMIAQTRKETFFDLMPNPKRSCRFYYDVESDDLVALNNGPLGLWLVALNVGAATGPNRTLCLNPGEKVAISPGYWGIMEYNGEGKKGELLAECLVLPRRCTFELRTMSTAIDATLEQDGSEVKAEGKQVVCTSFGAGDNPMLKVTPRTKVRVRFPAAPGEEESGEDFEITNFRNIAKPSRRTGIFHGLHSKWGTHVAVKIVRRTPVQKDQLPQLARDWGEEVRLLKAVNHPGIVKYRGCDARFLMIFMEYLGQDDLGSQRNRKNMYTGPLIYAYQILKDMASILVYLEREGILHNDIKAPNMIFRPERGAILIDFGLATYAGDGQSGGGTYPYIAPERYRVATPSHPNEVYSLGITMLYLMKKVALPECVQRERWYTESPSPAYFSWLADVNRMRDELEGPLGMIVKQMLHESPKTRITARQIVEQLETAEEEEWTDGEM